MWRNICSSVSKRPPPDILLIDPSQAKITTNKDGADTQTDTDRQTEERRTQDWTDRHRSMAETRQDRQETRETRQTGNEWQRNAYQTTETEHGEVHNVRVGLWRVQTGSANPTSLIRPLFHHGQAPNTLQSDIDTLKPRPSETGHLHDPTP